MGVEINEISANGKSYIRLCTNTLSKRAYGP